MSRRLAIEVEIWYRYLRIAGLWLSVLVTFSFLLLPIVVVALASFEGEKTTYFHFPPETYSLRWYWDIPSKYIHSFGVSLAVGVIAAVIATTLGAAAALGIVRGTIPGKNMVQALLRVPLQIPFIVTGVVFLNFYYVILDTSGINLRGTVWGLVIVYVFVTMPYSIGAISVVLLRRGQYLEEAAQIHGASNWAVFHQVTFPTMVPGIFASLFYSFIISFGDIPIAVFISDEENTTLAVEIFRVLQFDFDPQVLSVSTIVALISFALVILVQRVVGLDLVLPSHER